MISIYLLLGWGYTSPDTDISKCVHANCLILLNFNLIFIASQVLMQVELNVNAVSYCGFSYAAKEQFLAGNRNPDQDTCGVSY